MTFASVTQALAQLFTAVPGIQTVERAEQQLLSAPGSVQPQQDDPERLTPLLRLTRARRPAAQERGWELDGTRQTHHLIDCDLWAFVDDVVGAAAAFEALLETAKGAVRRSRDLGGAADTEFSRVLQVKVVEHAPPTQSLASTRQKPLLRGGFRVDAWEEVAG